ncbi:unnamed protein product [Dovyalis caffra]|uniref:Rieske domain-containing protein n=1 Tax=Dovyalis caffra TaxID=77055 RepID=A0AAV1RTP7_9ROSI|nr:unnamed protein product [Dovyalis caffra]
MEALLAPVPSAHFSIIPTTHHKPLSSKPRFLSPKLNAVPILSISPGSNNISKSKVFSTISSSFPVSAEEEPETAEKGEEKNFDWSSQWYPVMPVCDLDKRVPHAKRVMGLDIVVWWDRNESEWRVFNDACPHRLAPLSEGRIDQRGRLQCVYHGWCFNGSGECKFIPQAPPDGPLASRYHGITDDHLEYDCLEGSSGDSDRLYLLQIVGWDLISVIFHRSESCLTDISMPLFSPEYKHILLTKQPPYISELDDPSYTKVMTAREFPFGLPSNQGNVADQVNGSVSSDGSSKDSSSHQRRELLVFFCVPVGPGKSRLIFTLPRNFGVWSNRIIPRWVFHLKQNRILDSDLYLLHIQERKMIDVGPSNWQKAYFVPTKSDAQVVAFRKWLQKYSGGQINWGGKFSGALPPTPPKEQLMDRYWSHVVNCRSCSLAYKGFNALEIMLQVISIGSIGVDAATKQNLIVLTKEEPETAENEEERFDWFSQWHPVMPVCDLDKRVPHAKRVIGLDIVVWWDRNESEWRVFNDACPHRLAPLSEGRIDQRLQCLYHGWCFNGSGECKFIPQAPPDGPPHVHINNKACVSFYPSTEQNGILLFWPNSDPQFKDIHLKKMPPYIPELDDPSYTNMMGNRDMPYGYEILVENLMDPAQVPYAHYGLQKMPQPKSR